MCGHTPEIAYNFPFALITIIFLSFPAKSFTTTVFLSPSSNYFPSHTSTVLKIFMYYCISSISVTTSSYYDESCWTTIESRSIFWLFQKEYPSMVAVVMIFLGVNTLVKKGLINLENIFILAKLIPCWHNYKWSNYRWQNPSIII